MLGTAIRDSTAWHVLILDPVTVKTISSVMRMSDLLADHNIALLEDLNKYREPMQGTVGIYFISPSEASVRRLIFDFGSQPMHSVAHVFFSSPAPAAILAEIRAVPNLVARLRSLKEVRRGRAFPQPPSSMTLTITHFHGIPEHECILTTCF